MKPRVVTGTTAGVCLAAGLLAAAAPGLAATVPPRGSIVGKIARLSSTRIQVKTARGTVTEKLTSSTVISEITRGSLKNVTKGTFVTMTLGANHTVTAISIGSRFGGFRGPGPTRSRRTGARRPPSGAFAGRFNGGQVVSIGGGKLTVRSFLGKSTTYTLSKTVTVTRSVRATRSALKVGETVRVAAAPGSTTAFAVTIENA